MSRPISLAVAFFALVLFSELSAATEKAQVVLNLTPSSTKTSMEALGLS